MMLSGDKSQAGNNAVERWLREQVVPVAIAQRASTDRGVPARKVFDKIRALHLKRLKAL